MSDNTIIKVNGLKKHFTGGTVKALDGVDLEIKKGEVIRKVPEAELLNTLREELLHWND